MEEIQNKKFNDNKFNEMAGYNKEYLTINSIEGRMINLRQILLKCSTLCLSIHTHLVNDNENKIYLVKLVNSKKNTFR